MILSSYSWVVIAIVGIIYTTWYIINHKERSLFIKLGLIVGNILGIGAIDRITYKYFKLLERDTYNFIIGLLIDLLYTFIFVGGYIEDKSAGKNYSKKELVISIVKYLIVIIGFSWLFFIHGIL